MSIVVKFGKVTWGLKFAKKKFRRKYKIDCIYTDLSMSCGNSNDFSIIFFVLLWIFKQKKMSTSIHIYRRLLDSAFQHVHRGSEVYYLRLDNWPGWKTDINPIRWWDDHQYKMLILAYFILMKSVNIDCSTKLLSASVRIDDPLYRSVLKT